MEASTTGEQETLRRRAADMIAEGGAVWPNADAHAYRKGSENDDHLDGEPRPSKLEAIPHAVSRLLEDASRKWGTQRLKTLFEQKGYVSKSMGVIPKNMHRVASQTQLVLELIDDFREGTYRDISWRSIALLVGAVLYAVSPADVIPDAIPFFGSMDDLAVLALVTRMVKKDLRKYCAFKGYPIEEYFRPS